MNKVTTVFDWTVSGIEPHTSAPMTKSLLPRQPLCLLIILYKAVMTINSVFYFCTVKINTTQQYENSTANADTKKGKSNNTIDVVAWKKA